ncbi:hypothetical protein L596_013164 [Steinernema carpocapsae]|uniref:BTB domain-containing protein n=1 Tax=Steinernema carpocapsae TaxID=34508 RepID=A0A4U5NZU5_STECR|nr:hypothetical protein L596_013164 [Steinernema carpocapsae]
MGISGNSIGRLMEIADFYQAKIVFNRCGDHLRTSPNTQISLAQKLLLVSQCKLHSAALEIINKASVEELKALSSTDEFSSVVASLISKKLRCFES